MSRSNPPVNEGAWHPARKLEAQLAALLDAPLLDSEKSEWLLPIVACLARPGRVLLPSESQLAPRSPAARLWLFVRLLERRPEAARRLGAVVRALLEETTAVHLFCDAGMLGYRSLAAEVVNRISSRLLPVAPDDKRLDEVVALLFPDKRTSRWLVTLPDPLLDELWATIFNSLELDSSAQGGTPWSPLRDDAADAVILLAGRVAAHGMENDVRIRSGPLELRESPFFTLPQLCQEAAELARSSGDREEAAPALDKVHAALLASQALIARAMAHQETHGVSVDLVHRLDRMSRQLARIEQLLRLLFPDPAASAAQGRRLFATLVSQTCDDRSVSHLLRASVQLLSRKIVESASATGEHYIAQTRSEYQTLLRSAAAAGLLTALTTLIKYSLSELPLPPFFLGLLSSLNYGVSFLILYLLGWTLATKQPAATAATLARAMRHLDTEEDRERMVEQIACATRSQLAAIAGNLCTVIPGVIALDLLWRALSGHHFFDVPHAEHALRSLHPTRSLLVFYAAFTGVLLWASSIIAGWAANWAAYRRLPEAMARSRTLLRVLGADRRARLTAFFTRNVAGISGNLALGFLLGMAPYLGAFFGLPTEIRHVTLSTGLIALATSAFGPSGVAQASFYWALLGIAIIGLLNFTVSFRLALWLASRACGLERSSMVRLRGTLLRSFWRAPGRFFLDPR